MMVELAPSGKGPIHRVVESVLENLAADDISLPKHVLIDDGDLGWRRHAAALPVELRRSSVLATAADASLVDAVLFEIGGALRLPVSTPSMEAACESAAFHETSPIVPLATQGVVDALLSGAAEVLIVGWRQQAFWQHQSGPIRPINRLVEIAERLAIIPVILPGPVLVVDGRSRAEVEIACGDAETGSDSSAFPAHPKITRASTSDLSAGVGFRIVDVLAAVAGGGAEAEDRPEINLPVLEIPSGRRIGQWSLAAGNAGGGAGWHAFPREGDDHRGRWEIVTDEGLRETIIQTASLESDEVEGQSVIRAPGFVGAALRRGSPAGLLIETMTRHAARAGRPIWVPSVDAEGVRFLLGLPGPIWVDGPGVPD